VESVGPVYRFLSELNILITKSVWVFPTTVNMKYTGSTLCDREYLRFVLDLQKRGFEIGLHNIQNGDATRDRIEHGVEEFHNLLGHYPRVHTNHLDNRENLYWGPERVNQRSARLIYNMATQCRYIRYFQGHRSDSPYFWGDICKERITYVRNLIFDEINLTNINPTLPYHDPSKPYVNFWFSSSEGSDVLQFCRMISEERQDRLESEGGVCIMYTHFASGFCKDGVLHPEFRRLMTRLAAKDGWFVPVSPMLDFLREQRASSTITPAELTNTERRWLKDKVRSLAGG
jgi:hypothetical protein